MTVSTFNRNWRRLLIITFRFPIRRYCDNRLRLVLWVLDPACQYAQHIRMDPLLRSNVLCFRERKGDSHFFVPAHLLILSSKMFVNEFQGLILSCDDSYTVPNIPNADPLYQTCNIQGARPGQISVTGAQYLEAFGWRYDHRWRNIGIMIAIAVVYVLASLLGSEIMRFTPQGGAPIVYVKKSKKHEDSEQRVTDPEKEATTLPSSGTSSGSELHRVSHQGPALTWKDLTVDIGEKQILKGISAYLRPGDFVALCGASGAGKTTLLTALSQTNFAGQLGGDVLFGGQSLGEFFKKITGFAQQQDMHEGTATVREALEFSALLRQPDHYSRAEKLQYVDHVIDLFDLKDVENALIGTAEAGLGVELTKRVTIAIELVSRPKVLFADEPTSGLDSQGAAHIVDYLKRLSLDGQAVLVTIHQPSASLFAKFDRFLALSSEGRQLFFGPVQSVLPYFARHNAVPPPNTNPAEFVLDQVGAGVHAREDTKASDWANTWSESPEARAVNEELAAINKQNTTSDDFENASKRDYNGSLASQSYLLTIRILRSQWRNVPYMYSKLWVHVVSALLAGLTFFDLGTGPQDLQNR